MTAPATTGPEPLAGRVESLLARWGIASSEEIDAVTASARTALDETGHSQVTVVGYRWGQLTLEADATSRHFLSFDVAKIETAVRDAARCPVEVRVRTRRSA